MISSLNMKQELCIHKKTDQYGEPIDDTVKMFILCWIQWVRIGMAAFHIMPCDGNLLG